MQAADWAQKLLCIVVPNRRTVSPEFFSWVHTRRLLSCHTCPVRSPSLCEQGKLLFSTFLTRNEGTTDESKKRLGCYQQEQFNLPREYSVFDSSQCIVNNRKLVPNQEPACLKRYTKNYRRVLQSILSCQEPERNRSNKRHDASTVLRTLIVSNMLETTRCDKSLTSSANR